MAGGDPSKAEMKHPERSRQEVLSHEDVCTELCSPLQQDLFGCMCACVCPHVCHGHLEGIESGAGVTGTGGPPDKCWEPNPGP